MSVSPAGLGQAVQVITVEERPPQAGPRHTRTPISTPVMPALRPISVPVSASATQRRPDHRRLSNMLLIRPKRIAALGRTRLLSAGRREAHVHVVIVARPRHDDIGGAA